MIRLGILGARSGHAVPFARLLTTGHPELAGAGPARVTAVWSPDGQAAARVAAVSGARVCQEAVELVAMVDAVLVLDDEGGGASHAALAAPALDARVPVFVDKPLMDAYQPARRLLADAAAAATPLCTASAVRYAPALTGFGERLATLGELRSLVLTGPGDWWFYGVHLAEVAVALLGRGFGPVARTDTRAGCVAVTTHAAGAAVVLQVLGETGTSFHLAAHGTGGTHQVTLDGYEPWYARLLADVVAMARTGRTPVQAADTLEALGVLDAGARAAGTGRAEPLPGAEPLQATATGEPRR